ncbi:MAG: YggS family pyridoxal phosphate enzyme [Solirubrobacterales bacterium]
MARQVEQLDPGRVTARLAEVQERIAAAGRDPGDVELLAAVKYVPVDQMGALADAGVTLVGENTAQALIAKQERWGDRFVWDFIGHLQSRKTKDVLPRVRLIHSVESDSVVEKIQRLADGPTRVLLEVNVAGEESKYGVPLAEVDRFVERAGDKVVFGGLMTMPPFAETPEDARSHFARLRELRDRLQAEWGGRHDFATLSMGTTQDFEVAAEEGATIVRLGSVLYG